MPHFISQQKRQRHSEHFFWTLYSTNDGKFETETYNKISYELGAFRKKGNKMIRSVLLNIRSFRISLGQEVLSNNDRYIADRDKGERDGCKLDGS